MTKETIEQIKKFRDDRNWMQFHNPKDLAISISLEAAELLEIFQWSAGDVECVEKMDKIREDNMKEFEKILTPDQKKKFEKIKEERKPHKMDKKHKKHDKKHDGKKGEKRTPKDKSKSDK